jgi:hypothetical protein
MQSSKWELVPRYLEDKPAYAIQDINMSRVPQLCEGGYGVMSYYQADGWMPPECKQFVIDQFLSLRLVPPGDDFLYWCWEFMYYYVEQMDPYVFFFGGTDVVLTEENYHYQYSVTSGNRDSWEDVHPDNIEVFRYWPKGEEAWATMMRYPGLEDFYPEVFEYFSEHFNYVRQDDHPEAYKQEWTFIHRYGNKVNDFAHLGIWAVFMWMCSPMAKSWRGNNHPIFDICYRDGECVINGWCFMSPEYYKRQERHPMSCASCGVVEHCVELVPINNQETKFICEHCCHPQITEEGNTCGSTQCAKTSCPNHPGATASRLVRAKHRYGDLQERSADGRHYRELPGMMTINKIAIEHSAKGLAELMGDELTKLLSF